MFSSWVEFTDEQLLSGENSSHFGEQTYLVKVKASPTELFIVKKYRDVTSEKKRNELTRKTEFQKFVQHDHIVKVFSYFFENQAFSVVMEYCEGGSLKKFIEAQNGQLIAEELIRDWTAQIAKALKFLHKQSWLHRNVKSENIYLTGDGNKIAKLANFKTANTSKNLTHLAPEVLTGESYSFKAETWSLGVVVFEIATLKLPFTDDNNTASNSTVLKNEICSKEIPPMPNSYSTELCDLVTKWMLDRNVEKRPTIQQLCHASKYLHSIYKKERTKKNEKKAAQKRQFQEIMMKRQVEQVNKIYELENELKLLKNEKGALCKELEVTQAKKEEAERQISNLLEKIQACEKSEKEAATMIADLESIVEASQATQLNKQTQLLNTQRQLEDTLLELEQASSTIETLKKQLDALRQRPENSDKLIEAIKGGDESLARQLLEAGINVETKIGNNPALIWAAKCGRLKMVQLLVEFGANVEIKTNNNGATPLICAVIPGHYETVKFLVIDCNANLEAKNNDGNNSLIIAADYGHLNIAALLLNTGKINVNAANDNGSTALIQASIKGHADIVKILLENGANLEASDLKTGSTALLEAASKGHVETVRLLLEHGTNVKHRGIDGATPLVAASACGHVSVVRLLLEKGADLEAKTNEGATSLILAAQNGHIAIVRVLTDRGANVKAEADNGYTALTCAREQNHKEIIQLLQLLF